MVIFCTDANGRLGREDGEGKKPTKIIPRETLLGHTPDQQRLITKRNTTTKNTPKEKWPPTATWKTKTMKMANVKYKHRENAVEEILGEKSKANTSPNGQSQVGK